jgi:N-acetylmuramoyl-L-alanine amidase
MTKRGIITIAAILLIAAVAVVLVLTLRHPAPTPVEAVQTIPTYIVALDPGHGGRDPGAVSGDVLEKNLNLAIAQKTQALMATDPRLQPVMTRTADTYVALEDRIAKAEAAGAQIYVCIHVNSFDQPDAAGVETWVDNTRADDDPSWVLASMVQSALSNATAARNRGIRTQESFLQRTTMPAVSVEVGYLTNPDELTKLLDPAYQATIATGIVQGVEDFIDWMEESQSSDQETSES